MVYAICQTCGQLQHFNLSIDVDLGEWYEKFAPGLKPEEQPSIECYGCSRALSIGHRVQRIIREPNEKPRLGVDGVITAVDAAEPNEFIVEFEDSTQNGKFTRLDLRSSGEMQDNFKDQCDVLCDATEDWYGVDEAKTTLQDLSKARRAIETLFKKEYISLWWYTCWAGSEAPTELMMKDARNAMYKLKHEDQWWDAGDYMNDGYYAYTATEKGREYFFKNPLVRFYMRNEWHQRAYARGQISEDLFRKIEDHKFSSC